MLALRIWTLRGFMLRALFGRLAVATAFLSFGRTGFLPPRTREETSMDFLERVLVLRLPETFADEAATDGHAYENPSQQSP
jgi:hypothetical protein